MSRELCVTESHSKLCQLCRLVNTLGAYSALILLCVCCYILEIDFQYFLWEIETSCVNNRDYVVKSAPYVLL